MQRWNVEGAEGSWPVRNREPRVVAGDERACNDQNKSRARCEDSEAVMRAIVGCSERLQWITPCIDRQLPSFARLDGSETRPHTIQARTGETPVLHWRKLLRLECLVYRLAVFGG